jgi:predicted ATPase
MIDRLRLKFGASQASPLLEFQTTPITIFVGPNNSGKSKLIREIFEQVTQGHVSSGQIISDQIFLQDYDYEQARSLLREFEVPLQLGEVLRPDHIMVGGLGGRSQAHLPTILRGLTQFNTLVEGDHHKTQTAQQLLRYKVKLLDGQSRIALCNDQALGDLQTTATTSFQILWRNDQLRENLREIVFDALGDYLTFDPTGGGTIRLRLSQRKPEDVEEEQSLTQRAANFHAKAALLGQASDGAKAFCGIMAEVMAGKPDLLLIDEPEAFLHPTLSFKLAKNLAKQMAGSQKRLFVSTHSPNFLMGCVSAGVPVNVVRLTYRNRVATARILPSDELRKAMRNPLLRSAGVLSALFYENVVVTEGDTDRAFYHEINERLLSQDQPDLGIPNCLFLNGTGKDQIPTIMGMLRSFGIPAAGIYDLDFIGQGGTEQSKRLKAASLPEAIRNGLGSTRLAVLNSLQGKDQNYKRKGGLTLLSGHERESADLYLKTLSEYGVFLVPNGEVESWLSEFEIGGHSTDWLVPMFERLGSDETSPDYVRPAAGDVWDFLRRVRLWLLQPDRSGIPS